MKTKAFWNRVKKLIKSHNLSQRQFAEKIGIPLGSLEGMIYHNREPVLSLAVNIAGALGVTIEFLANGRDREIVNKRLYELAVRETTARISKLSLQIQKETKRITGHAK